MIIFIVGILFLVVSLFLIYLFSDEYCDRLETKLIKEHLKEVLNEQD